LIGAKTVNGPSLLSVSTSQAAFTAATSVVTLSAFTALSTISLEGIIIAPPTSTHTAASQDASSVSPSTTASTAFSAASHTASAASPARSPTVLAASFALSHIPKVPQARIARIRSNNVHNQDFFMSKKIINKTDYYIRMLT